MVRADITSDEWKRVRKIAIDRSVTIQAWMASAIREKLEREASNAAA